MGDTVVEEEVVNGLSENGGGLFYGFVIGVVGQKIFHIPALSSISFPGMMTPMKLVRTISILIAFLTSCAQVAAEVAGVEFTIVMIFSPLYHGFISVTVLSAVDFYVTMLQ